MARNHSSVNDTGASNCAAYSVRELVFFEDILNDAYGDMCEAGGSLSVADHAAETKAQLKAAIFRRAASGERNYLYLKYQAIESLF